MAGVVGGAFLASFLQVLFDRMASREVFYFIRGKKGLLKKLKILLLSVNTVLNDAEEKQITSFTVKSGLMSLKMQFVMDEIATEALKCNVEADQSKSSTSQVQRLISTSLGLFEKERIEIRKDHR
ncbi:hypothetical protein CRYUN_Cryun09bG0116200 [Craigia yunnanensis]